MKKILSILLAVTLLAALAVPMTVSAAKVDLGAKAQEAINELAKYNTTPVGENFNVKTMMGYVFGTMTKDGKDSQYFDEDMGIRYVWYKIPAATLENKMLGCFANGRAAITEMTSMSVLDYTWEYGGKVADAQLKVYQPGYYYFNDYNLDRTEIVKGYPIKSKTGFVAENPKTYTVNGYKSAGGYKYDVYATDNTGAVVKFTIEWGGGDIKFVSTAAASSVPGGLTAPGTQADLAVTTTAKATTTTTAKKQPTTTTTTKAADTTTAGGQGGTTTTTTKAAEDDATTTTEAVSGNVTTTTAAVSTDGALEETPDEGGADNTTTYIIIGVVLGVLVLGIIAAIIIVLVKQKKK